METGVCPFQVSVGVVRLKTLVVDSTERDNPTSSLSVSIGLRLQATVKSGVGGTLQYGAVVARPGLSTMGDVSIGSLV